MECGFLRVGDNEPCHLQPTKNSKYCALHNFLIKKSQVKLVYDVVKVPGPSCRFATLAVLIK